MRATLATVTGVLLFATGFFLPAVQDGAGTESFPGWWCAWISLSAPIANLFEGDPSFRELVPLFLAGLINPLVLLFLGTSASKRLRLMRLLLAAGIVLCSAGMWIFLAMENIRVRAGHVVWMSGIALILLPEIVARRANID